VKYGARLPIVAPWARKIVIYYFDVKILWGGSRENGRHHIFIGPEDKVPTAICIYNFLVSAMENGWSKYYSANRHRAQYTDIGALKNGYYQGFYNGLSSRLDQNKVQIERDLLTDSASKQTYALVRQSVEEAIEKYVKQAFGKVKIAKEKNRPLDSDSYSIGHRDGRETTLARAYVGA
jgi:hypothetical protein